jgi:cytochrome b
MERTRILVWDLPLRVFHWLLAASFAGAFLTAEGDGLRAVHLALGYTFLGLLAFRLLWGVVGSRHARFRAFAYGPKAVREYLGSLLARRPMHYVGHNPAGSWAIYALLALGLVVGVTGYAVQADAGGRWLEGLHEGASNALLALVIVHVAGVIVGSLAHRENLVAAMVTGRKTGRPGDGIGHARWLTAAMLIAVVGAFWSAAVAVPGLLGPDAGAAAVHASAADGEAGGPRVDDDD